MTSRPQAALQALADEFDILGDDWEERMSYVIDIGRTMPPLPKAAYRDANKVPGCASQVWLVSERTPDGAMVFRGDSDAHITKGLVGVVLRLYSGAEPAEILAFDAASAMKRLGLDGHLTRQRANGLASMVARIRSDAERAAA